MDITPFRLAAPPLILGLVLGPLAENRLFLSTDNYGLAWLLRPGVLILIGLTLVGAFYPLVKLKWQKSKKEKGDPSEQEGVSRMGPRSLRLNWEAVFSLFIIGVIALALWQSRHFDLRTGLFPWAIGFPVLALTVFQIVMEWSGKGSRKSGDQMEEARLHLPPALVNRRTAGMFGWILGYFAAIWLLGFSLGVPLCTFIQLKIFNREKWLLGLIYTAAAWALIYGIFDRVLHVPFPQGQLFLWLKLSSV